MELLEAFVADVDHVAGFVPVVLDVFGEGLGNGEMLFFVLRGEEGRGQIVVAAVDHDLKAGIGLEGFGQVGSDVYADRVAVVLEVPWESAAEEGLGQIGLTFAVLQVLADVVVEERDVGGGDGRALRIVFCALAQRVEIRAGEASVETAGGQFAILLEGLFEFAAVDAEIGAEQVVDWQADVVVQLFGDGLLFIRGDVGTESESVGVGAHGEVFDLFQEGLEGGRLLGKLFVIPGCGGVGGQGEHVGKVDAGVCAGAIDVGGEVEDLRKQNDAVEVDAFAVFENVGEDGGAGGAIALAEDVLGRVPAVVLGDETGDEAGEGVGVFVDAPEGLSGVLADEAAEAGAGHVDEDDVADVEQGAGVVDELVGSGGQVLIGVGDDVLGAERTHVEPDGGAAGTAVVEEGDGALFSLGVFFEVGDVKHARDGSLHPSALWARRGRAGCRARACRRGQAGSRRSPWRRR